MWCNGGLWNLHTNYLPHPPIIPFGTHQNSSFFMYQIVKVSLKSAHFNPTHPPIIPFGTQQISRVFLCTRLWWQGIAWNLYTPPPPPPFTIPFITHSLAGPHQTVMAQNSLKSQYFDPTHPPIIPFITHQFSRFFMFQTVMAQNSLKSQYFDPTHPPIIPFITHQFSRFFTYQIVMSQNSLKSQYFDPTHPPIIPSVTHTGLAGSSRTRQWWQVWNPHTLTKPTLPSFLSSV